LGLDGYEREDLWNCVTCNACGIRCPRGIDIVDVMRSTRAVMIEAGTYPQPFNVPLGSLRAEGNPWSVYRKYRFGVGVRLSYDRFSGEIEIPLFLPAVHKPMTEKSQGRPRIDSGGWRKAGVSFGVSGRRKVAAAIRRATSAR